MSDVWASVCVHVYMCVCVCVKERVWKHVYACFLSYWKPLLFTCKKLFVIFRCIISFVLFPPNLAFHCLYSYYTYLSYLEIFFHFFFFFYGTFSFIISACHALCSVLFITCSVTTCLLTLTTLLNISFIPVTLFSTQSAKILRYSFSFSCHLWKYYFTHFCGWQIGCFNAAAEFDQEGFSSSVQKHSYRDLKIRK